MNFFILILLVLNIVVTVLFGIMFFQLKTLNYTTTGCDTEEGKEKIKSALGLYDNFLIGLIVVLSISAVSPIFSLVKNILAVVFVVSLGSIIGIIIASFEIAVIIGLITFMVIILINIRKVGENPCGDKNLLVEKLNYVSNLVKFAFIISLVLSIVMIFVAIGYFIYSYKKKKKEEREEVEALLQEEQGEIQQEPQTIVTESVPETQQISTAVPIEDIPAVPVETK